ncbi:universal stress protein [Halapricum hydrolyticum]|uniref:Universal stress protein n=1 Tax=Halapricum hydrolyticum TaxID=2979991 RepID=A0AAE3LEE7_9EURY|nr:universal stress protein [Halapricum hydrolyticum]MCU4716500.1 universal stress protein [Halapricum hydrolyticum]MCU4725895.1 universal stress protein [Halapricum hydrolyticum]
MTESVLERTIVPVADPDDAAATTEAVASHVDDVGGTVIAVHVIEKAGGALDKASVEQREQAARDLFAVVRDGLSDTGITLETEILYGTDVAQTLIDAAHDLDASAIVFTPRGGSRWQKLLSGDVTHHLLNNSDVPILVFPEEDVSES